MLKGIPIQERRNKQIVKIPAPSGKEKAMISNESHLDGTLIRMLHPKRPIPSRMVKSKIHKVVFLLKDYTRYHC
jgi:hypothetical protein